MALTNENVGPKILAKIKIYALTRAELLFQVCYEIPCTSLHYSYNFQFLLLQTTRKASTENFCLYFS